MEINIKATPEEIAKMLQVIESSKEQKEPYCSVSLGNLASNSLNIDTEESKETRNIFEGINFKNPPASKEEYIKAYEEYVKRCSN